MTTLEVILSVLCATLMAIVILDDAKHSRLQHREDTPKEDGSYSDDLTLEFDFIKAITELDAIEETKDFTEKYLDRIIELKSKIAGMACLIGYDRVCEILDHRYRFSEDGIARAPTVKLDLYLDGPYH